jgi:hypothetical protein
MRQGRKRSAAISLVLAGSLSGCSDPVPQRDVYQSLANCQRDWNGPGQCQQVGDGRYSNTWYYGPNHFGSSYSSGRPRPSPNAIESNFSPRGTSVATARSTGGSPGGGSGVSRGGFGSTSSAMSSGS